MDPSLIAGGMQAGGNLLTEYMRIKAEEEKRRKDAELQSIKDLYQSKTQALGNKQEQDQTALSTLIAAYKSGLVG